MKKTALIVASLSLNLIYAQNNEKLNQYLDKQKMENEAKYNSLFKNASGRISINNIKLYNDSKNKLAGFAGKIPLFYEPHDTRANKSANIETLQNGTLTGLNGNTILGTNMNILVMDEGRVFEMHNEFGGPTNGGSRIFNKESNNLDYNNHSTNVAGIIAAAGVQDFGTSSAKGVLPNVTIDSYTYQITNGNTNYKKLVDANANISNHSYGTSVGWFEVKTDNSNSIYNKKGFYWVGNYSLNHLDTYSSAYDEDDKQFDMLVYNNPNQIIIKSVGNDYGRHPSNNPALPKFKYDNTTNKYIPFADTDEIPAANCSQGFNCIGFGSVAKNIIVVGAVNALSTTDYKYTSPNDIVKINISNAGPRKDGAIKPDICATGSNFVIPNYVDGTTYNSYSTNGIGTSYSTPIISGIAGAVTEINRIITGNSSFMFKADEMKALLTHTANEAGNNLGPDVWYGWGFADAQKAAQLIIDKKDNKAIFERNTLTSGVKFTKEITANGTEPLKATISWIDPAGKPFTEDIDYQNNHSSMLINDLDLRIIDTTDNSTYYPWKLDINNPLAAATQADNTVDNVEQVLLNNPISGRKYTIEVTNKGTLVNDGNLPSPQNYALIITGITDSSSLSTQENPKENLATVYPTKTKDWVNILIPKEGISIEIFDLSGKTILKVPAKNFQTIDLTKFPKGIYIINIKTEKNTISKKIIKE